MDQKKRYDVTALGELNVDIILNQIDGFPEMGKEKFAGSMTVTLGSSTAIFAANIACLGARTAFAGMVGKDSFGDLVCRSLAERGVDTSFIIRSREYSTGATVVMSYDEDRANLTYQGAMDHMGFDNIDPALFKSTRHIHISSVFMQTALMQSLSKVFAAAHANGVTISMDTQWDPKEKWDFDYRKILPEVDVFMPNETELRAIAGTEDFDEAVYRIQPYLRQAAVIKCGSRGSLLIRKDGTITRMEPFLNRTVVDTVGAGDSFNAGFIYGYVNGRELSECQRLGNLTGAVSTTAAGGTGAFTDLDSVRRLAEEKFGEKLF